MSTSTRACRGPKKTLFTVLSVQQVITDINSANIKLISLSHRSFHTTYLSVRKGESRLNRADVNLIYFFHGNFRPAVILFNIGSYDHTKLVSS